jgi:F-type H+-transporting ATPase subunit b
MRRCRSASVSCRARSRCASATRRASVRISSACPRAWQETEADRHRRMEETKRQIEAETQRALGEIRREVAELALVAAEKVTAGALTDESHRKLIDDAIRELDFSKLEQERVA